jgi:CheY-like chemotaxis protein
MRNVVLPERWIFAAKWSGFVSVEQPPCAAVRTNNLTEQTLVLLVQATDILVAELIEAALVRAGCEVHRAVTGEGALVALADTKRVAGLVVDVDLSGPMTGWEVAHHARELHPNIVVVYTSAGSAEECQSKRVRGSRLITKPVVPDQITTALSRLLNEAQ